jgi:hypothetical protein
MPPRVALAITEYVGKRTSRALVFPLAHLDHVVVLDEPGLVQLVPPDLRSTLREKRPRLRGESAKQDEENQRPPYARDPGTLARVTCRPGFCESPLMKGVPRAH